MELLWRSKNDQENLFVRTSKSSFIQRALELLRKHFDEGVGREIAVDLYKNGDVSLWRALRIDQRLSVCHALLNAFTKTLV